MDAIYSNLGSRVVEAARTAAMIHQALASHSFRQATQIGGTDMGSVTEDAAVSDALVDDCPAGLHPHPEKFASPNSRRAGRSSRHFNRTLRYRSR